VIYINVSFLSCQAFFRAYFSSTLFDCVLRGIMKYIPIDTYVGPLCARKSIDGVRTFCAFVYWR